MTNQSTGTLHLPRVLLDPIGYKKDINGHRITVYPTMPAQGYKPENDCKYPNFVDTPLTSLR